MAKSTLIDVADAVAVLIEATILAHGGTTERTYVPTMEMKDLALLKASVVDREETRKPSERGSWQREYVVDIALRKKVGDDDDLDDESDTLSALVETVANLLEDTALAVVPVRLTELKINGPDRSYLSQHKAFVSWIRASYRALRRVP